MNGQKQRIHKTTWQRSLNAKQAGDWPNFMICKQTRYTYTNTMFKHTYLFRLIYGTLWDLKRKGLCEILGKHYIFHKNLC